MSRDNMSHKEVRDEIVACTERRRGMSGHAPLAPEGQRKPSLNSWRCSFPTKPSAERRGGLPHAAAKGTQPGTGPTGRTEIRRERGPWESCSTNYVLGFRETARQSTWSEDSCDLPPRCLPHEGLAHWRGSAVLPKDTQEYGYHAVILRCDGEPALRSVQEEVKHRCERQRGQ